MQKSRKNNHANDNSQAQIIPTDRIDFLIAVSMDPGISAKESMAVRVATILVKHRHNETGKIVLKRKTIAEEIGCSPSAVDKGVAVLERQGWCESGNVYARRPKGAAPEIISKWYDLRWDRAAGFWGNWSIETRRRVDVDNRGVILNDEVCPRTLRPLHQNSETLSPERQGVSSRTLKQNSESSTRCSEPSEKNSHSAGHADADRNDRSMDVGTSSDDRQSADHWPSDGFDQFIEEMPDYTPFDDYDDADVTEDVRIARIRFGQLRESGKVSFHRLMDGVRRYAADIKHTGQCPCKPATFITGERWDDELIAAEQSQANDDAKLNRVSGEDVEDDPPF